MITETCKQDVRRHLSYGLVGLYRAASIGGSLSPTNIGLRYFNSYGQLEFKMNNLLPGEEARLSGNSYGAIAFTNANPINFTVPVQPGSTMTVSISSSLFSVNPVVLSYTVVTGDTLLSVCGSLALQAAMNGVFTSAGFYCLNDYGAGPLSEPTNPTGQIVSMPIVSFVGPAPGVNFGISVTGTGQTIPQILQQGMPLPPTLTTNNGCPGEKIWGYIPICNYLEDQMFGQTSDNLSVYKAGDATLRMSEPKERKKLYQLACKRLADYMAITMNPEAPSSFNNSARNWSVL